MSYICHCDICDKKILDTKNDMHIWALGEQELTPTSALYPAQMQICNDCFPLFAEEVQALKQRIQERRKRRIG